MQYYWHWQSTFLCLLRPSPRTPSFCVTPNRVDKSIWFYLRTQRKAGGLAQNDDCLSQTPIILQPSVEAITLPLHASSPKSIQSLFLLSILTTHTPGSPTLARTQASFCLAIYHPHVCSPAFVHATAFLSNIHATTSTLSYKQSIVLTSVVAGRR